MYNGMMVVRKEAGYTSSDVVAKLRGILHMKKIGHTGTLDPAATGVLPVCLGSATKLCDLIGAHDKEYRAILRLGTRTDTQDMTGQVLAQISDEEVRERVSEESLRSAAASFVGDYDQIPPMYSARKVNGKKLYELAREGKVIERKPTRVQILELELERLELPLVTMRVVCSKGTYIRTLCEDIGAKLGVGGTMQSLVRTRVGDFTLKQALTLEEIEALAGQEGELQKVILPVDFFFQHSPAALIAEEAKKYLLNGNVLYPDQVQLMMDLGSLQRTSSGRTIAGEETISGTLSQEVIRIYDREGRFYAVYRLDTDEQVLRPVKMFL